MLLIMQVAMISVYFEPYMPYLILPFGLMQETWDGALYILRGHRL